VLDVHLFRRTIGRENVVTIPNIKNRSYVTGRGGERERERGGNSQKNANFLRGLLGQIQIQGAATLSITTFNLMTLSIMTLSITTLRIMTFSITTFGVLRH
jgi:hypothetical protein